MTLTTLKEARTRLSSSMQIGATSHGEYRVNYRGGKEATAYYTNDLQDAFDTAMRMHEERDGTVGYDAAVKYLSEGNAHKLLREALREAHTALLAAGKVNEANCMSMILHQRGTIEVGWDDYMTQMMIIWVL